MTTGRPAAEASGAHSVPRFVVQAPMDPVADFLADLSMAVLKHPAAAQAVFSALVAEGQRFAHTDEGARWRSALADSDLARRGHALWEGSLLKVLEESPDAILPTAIVEAVVHATARADLTNVLQEVLDRVGPRG